MIAPMTILLQIVDQRDYGDIIDVSYASKCPAPHV